MSLSRSLEIIELIYTLDVLILKKVPNLVTLNKAPLIFPHKPPRMLKLLSLLVNIYIFRYIYSTSLNPKHSVEKENDVLKMPRFSLGW